MKIPTPPSPPPITAAVIPQSDPPPLNSATNQPTPPLTNGVLKRHKPIHHHQPPPVEVVSYKECLKNHAAAIGGHAVDGCGEFMPSPTSSSADPTSLKCAACGCHRNFHRRDPDESLFPSHHHQRHLANSYQPHHRHHPPPPSQPPPTAGSPGNSPSPPPISSSYYPQMALALATVPPPPADNNHIPSIPTTPLSGGACGSTKKRFRTKFTQDQKQKMQEMAERVDWKIQKRDEDAVLEFCNEIGVDRNVFKVWMHNNKTKDCVDKMNGIDFIISRNNDHHGSTGNNRVDHHCATGNNRVDHQLHLSKNGGFSGGENVVCSTKGSSSSC